jgi:hypothetical protein
MVVGQAVGDEEQAALNLRVKLPARGGRSWRNRSFVSAAAASRG